MFGGRVESRPAVAWIVVTDVSGVNVEVNGEARTKSTSSQTSQMISSEASTRPDRA